MFSFFQVPVRVAGGLLFELLGQSAGDPFVNEDDIPIVLRSWQAQNFLITVLHVKGSLKTMNVLGITEVQVVRSYQNTSLRPILWHFTLIFCSYFAAISGASSCWWL